MASFGSFETDREIYSEPSYTVFSARKSGDPKSDSYAIKIFSLQQLDLGAEAAAELEPLVTDLERLCVNRIAVQQQAAAASKYVSPILESGKDERGVWYATKFFPRSVNKIISGRVALNQEALHHIIQCVAQGALDFKRICGRSHGDIQRSNIQISRSEKLSEAEVVLSDPLPGGDADASVYELSDLKAIGQILIQLVRQREMSDAADWLILPILSSPEWTRLFQKDTDRWLALCNRLLDPNLSLDQITLEQLVVELEQLRPKPPVSRRVIVAAVVVLVLLGVGAFFVLRRSNEGRLELTSDPPGAEIGMEVEGHFQSRGKTPLDQTSLLITLPKGNYKVWAEYPGLLGQTNDVTVEGGKTRAHKFLFPSGRVQFTSTNGNVEVELDGKVVGFTPFTSPFLAPGKHVYRVSLTNHHPASGSVVVPADRQVVAVVGNLNKKKDDERQVEISFAPSGATIMEGTNVLGETSVRSYLTVGSHKITAKFQDWPPVTREIEVLSGENPPLEFYLPHGVALFDLKPEDAEILVNDHSLGRGVRRKVLQPRTYSVLVTNIGYYAYSTNLTITDSNVTRLAVSLKPMLGFVEFTTDPPGAAIFDAKLPEQKLGSTQPGQPLIKSFQPGSYSFIARYEGLDEVRSKQVDVAMGASISMPLAFKYGTVQFDTEPQGAEVRIGGASVKPSPYTHRQKPGLVEYRVELADYYPETGTKELSAGATIPLSFRLRRKEVGLVLRSVPPGAQYYMAETPLKGTNDVYVLPWGSYTITAKYPGPAGLPGLDAKTVSVPVDKNGSSSMKFEFSYATLEITNAEPEAKVLYQKQPIANLPARLFLKPDTQYDFELEYGTDFHTNLAPVKLAAGKSFTPTIVLPELRRTYTNSIGMEFIRVSKDLYAGKFEVTQGQFGNVMGVSDDGKPRLPVVLVSWTNALAFCQKLSLKDLGALEKIKLAGWTYALPTEEEWASCTGSHSDLSQLTEAVFSRLEGPLEIDPLRKSFNGEGFYDLFGNVAEWCSDANKQPITIGGASNRPRPRQFPTNLMRDPNPGKPVIEGSPTIGFRCVLKRLAQ
jgi:hypothetical protein